MMNTDLKMTTKDKQFAIAKAVVNTIPTLGGPLGSLLSDFIPTEIDRRRDDLLLKLEKDFEVFEKKFRENLFEDKEYISLFLKSFKSSMESISDEKTSAFRAIIINGATIQSPDYDELLYMVKMISNLTPLHLKLIKLFKNPENYLLQHTEVASQLGNVSMGGITTLTNACFPDYARDVIKTALLDLENNGIATKGITGGTTMTRSGILSPRLSEFGNRFLNYITNKDLK